MIKAIEQLDKKAALGILARTALALDGNASPETRPMLEGEDAVRSAMLRELKERIGVADNDTSAETIERVIRMLDDESERLTGPTDEASALDRLSQAGHLPPDLYQVNVVRSVKTLHRDRYDLEYDLIVATVHSPNEQQHYRDEIGPGQLISLFAHHFKTRWPHKDFTMLVAAERSGQTVNVHQAWRIYASQMPREPYGSLAKLLEMFANKFGVEVEVEGQRGRFFYQSKRASSAADLRILSPKPVVVTRFVQMNKETDEVYGALVSAIDINAYQSVLKSLSVERSDILDLALEIEERRMSGPRPSIVGDDAGVEVINHNHWRISPNKT